MGQSTEALGALARSKELHAAKKLSLPAEDLTILAMTQHLAGQPVEARATLEQVRTLASRNEAAWQKLLAEAESLLGVPKAADEPERWLGRQVMSRRAATVKHEVKSFDDAIGLAPTLGRACSWRAYVWSAKNDRDKMLQDLEKGIRLSPEDSGVWTIRAWLLVTSPNAEHRDGKQAVADGMKACELTDWSDYNCLENLAAAYAETSDFEQAVKWQEKAVALTPPAWRAEYESRLMLYREGKSYRDLPRSNSAVEK